MCLNATCTLPHSVAMETIAWPRSDKAERTEVLNYLRSKVIQTIWIPLVTVCDQLPEAPQLEVKIAVLRQYVREHDLDVKDGRGHRSFWKNVDRFYDEKIEELGGTFDSPGWRSYLRAIMEMDEQLAPPPGVQYIEPLFTYTPLVMKMFCILN
ncbi:hypothetical protein C8R47DRAFT_1083129 [Mycena vitilis]|nr:hypothetical protein C8R47DRAFT_1083129 [Mycena vitilis]